MNLAETGDGHAPNGLSIAVDDMLGWAHVAGVLLHVTPGLTSACTESSTASMRTRDGGAVCEILMSTVLYSPFCTLAGFLRVPCRAPRGLYKPADLQGRTVLYMYR